MDLIVSKRGEHAVQSQATRQIDVTWHISGGLGALGALAAAWLANGGASSLVLLGRTGHSRAVQQDHPAHLKQPLSAGLVHTARCDMSSSEETCEALGRGALAGARGRPGASSAQRGVLHAGGVLRDATLPNQTVAGARAVTGPKVAGLHHILAACAGMPVQALKLFSSVAAFLGSPGQLNYSTANAQLDAAAGELYRQGLAGVSVQWGPWGGGGMAQASQATEQRMERMGLHMLDAQQGLRTLAAAVGAVAHSLGATGLGALPHGAEPSVAAMSVSWDKVHAAVKRGVPVGPALARMAEHLWEGPVRTGGETTTGVTTSSHQLSGHLGPAGAAVPAPSGAAAPAVPGLHVLDQAEAAVSAVVTSVLGAEVGRDEPLMEAGLDSLAAVELRTELGTALGLELPATVMFDYPTVAALSGLVAAQSRAAAGPEAGTEGAGDVQRLAGDHLGVGPRDHSRGTALCAAEGQFAGQALGGMGGFWSSLAAAEEVCSAVPYSRWCGDRAWGVGGPGPASYVRFGHWIDGVELFEPQVFRLGQKEALGLDPQTRLLLMQTGGVVERLRDQVCRLPYDGGVGQSPAPQASTWQSPGAEPVEPQCGLFVACMWNDYRSLRLSLGKNNDSLSVGNWLFFMSGRLSYTFGLQGPCLALDTACSSSLAAAHLAHGAVMGGECAHALAAGSNLMLYADTTAGFCGLQALSWEGRCKTLDASADGYGRGEGAAMVALTSGLVEGTHAQEGEQDPPRTGPAAAVAAVPVLAGSAVNQDGRSSGLTAPNGPQQAVLVRAALRGAGHTAASVTYVALHGTGTPLGDPIELGALAQGLQGRPQDGVESGAAVGWGAVKSHCGHTEGTAGLAGLFMAAMALGQRAWPGLPHCRNLNPHVASALESRGGPGGPLWSSAPRQAGPGRASGRAPTAGGAPALAGTSSFGMSGTNAHAEVLAPDAAAGPGATPGTETHAWRPRPVWPVALPHALVSFASPGSAGAGAPGAGAGVCRLECRLAESAVHPMLWDNVVQGQVLLPGTAFMELAHAAAHALVGGAGFGGAAVVADASLVAPLVLQRAEPGAEPGRVAVQVLTTGAVRLASPAGTLHVAGHLAALAPASLRPRPAGGRRWAGRQPHGPCQGLTALVGGSAAQASQRGFSVAVSYTHLTLPTTPYV